MGWPMGRAGLGWTSDQRRAKTERLGPDKRAVRSRAAALRFLTADFFFITLFLFVVSRAGARAALSPKAVTGANGQGARPRKMPPGMNRLTVGTCQRDDQRRRLTRMSLRSRDRC